MVSCAGKRRNVSKCRYIFSMDTLISMLHFNQLGKVTFPCSKQNIIFDLKRSEKRWIISTINVWSFVRNDIIFHFTVFGDKNSIVYSTILSIKPLLCKQTSDVPNHKAMGPSGFNGLCLKTYMLYRAWLC